MLRTVRCRSREFLASTRGGAMLAGGVIMLTLMSTVGGLMANYAWREAQWEELRAGVRAAIASAGPMLGVGADSEDVRSAIAAFAAGAVGLSADSSDVTVAYDAVSDTTTIVVGGEHKFDNLWVGGGERESVAVEVKLRLEFERYEVALALDASDSMNERLRGATKLAALKDAVGGVVDSLAAASTAQPGSIMVSLVPYSSAVNVADTCNPHPVTGICDAARTPAKERYVRMLAGVRDTMADTLADARAAKTANEGGHWVDTFGHYGAASSHGPLQRRWLPTDLLEDRDWNLRRTSVDIDVSAEVPSVATWTVDDEDFWNGCVMARWGAYWHPDARASGWTASDAANWPARQAVAGWGADAPALAADTPLHLSDAPPDATDPSTLFTAYSWPDGAIAGRADAWLSDTALEMLHPGVVPAGAGRSYYVPAIRDNYWSGAWPGTATTVGGNRFCPPSPITPLSDDMGALRSAMDDLVTTPLFHSNGIGVGTTYLHLGVVWALRTLSPHWRGVWNVHDARRAVRPAVPCSSASDSDCDPSLTKAIVLVSDGRNFPGPQSTQLSDNIGVGIEPRFEIENLCLRTDIDTFRAADAETAAANFNAHFAGFVDDDGKLTSAGRDAFADAWFEVTSAPLHYWGAGGYKYPAPDPETPARRQALLSLLAAADSDEPATPWQLFSGREAAMVDALVGEDAFGFDGRPTLVSGRCRPSSSFGPYGRADDLVYAGDDQPPRADVAPFEVATVPTGIVGDVVRSPWPIFGRLASHWTDRLDDWLHDACRIAGERGVRVHGIHIGPETDTLAIGVLEACVDLAGGDPDAADVYVTPTADALRSAFAELLTLRRNLRFL